MTPGAAGRTLPHSIEAEELLLGSCFLDGPEVIPKALAAGVTSESFYDSKHGIIFASLVALLRAGKATEVFVVAEDLKTTKQLDQVGGYVFLTQVSSKVPTTAQASFFIEKVVEQATLRDLIRAGTRVVEDCYAHSGDSVADMVAHAVATIMRVGPESSGPTWKDALASAKARVDRQLDPAAATEPDDAISFGFSDLDRHFQPMRPGQVVVIGARPSVGKSSLARQIAYHNAVRAGEQTIFASLEVMGESLALNLAQTVAAVSQRGLSARSHARDAADYRAALESLRTPLFDVLAGSRVSLAAIQGRAQLLRAKGRPVRLAVIDYLQLLPDCVPTKGENRAGAIGRVSRAIKAFALAEACAVVVLSQLNRDPAKEGREPALYDLRESGDIEQDADKVVLLDRPSENPITKLRQDETSLPSEVPSFFVKCIQAKGRDDGTAAVGLNFRRAITRFEQITRTQQPEPR